MTLRDFVVRVRDEASRFHIEQQRAIDEHPEVFPVEQEVRAWLRAFYLWLLAGRRQP